MAIPPAPGAQRAAPAQRPRRVVALRQDGVAGPSWLLGREPVTCGRSGGELRFPEDPAVSPLHARLEPRPDALHAVDLGSLNGTFVRLTAPRALSPGDEIRLGRQLLRVEPIPERAPVSGGRPWGTIDPGYRARLVQLLEGGGTGEVFPLLPGENVIGRETSRVGFPADRFVSARHARIEVGASGVVIADLGSANGTFVRITGPEPLGLGSELLVGRQLLRLE